MLIAVAVSAARVVTLRPLCYMGTVHINLQNLSDASFKVMLIMFRYACIDLFHCCPSI